MEVIEFIVAVSVAEYIVALIRNGYHKEYKAGEYDILRCVWPDWHSKFVLDFVQKLLRIKEKTMYLQKKRFTLKFALTV